MITQDMIIGLVIILINIIPLVTKKYNMLYLTGAISLLLVFLNQFIK